MTSGIVHNCMPFLCCGWSCAFSSSLLDQMTSYILSKCGSSLHCGWACALSDDGHDKMTCGIGDKLNSFLCCGWPCAFSDLLYVQMTSHILNICAAFLFWGCTYSSFWWFGLTWVWTISKVVFVELNETFSWQRTNFDLVQRLFIATFTFQCLCYF